MQKILFPLILICSIFVFAGCPSDELESDYFTYEQILCVPCEAGHQIVEITPTSDCLVDIKINSPWLFASIVESRRVELTYDKNDGSTERRTRIKLKTEFKDVVYLTVIQDAYSDIPKENTDVHNESSSNPAYSSRR